MPSIRAAAALVCLLLAAGPAHASSRADAESGIRLSRLGAERPPRLREITPGVPETARLPAAETSRRAAPADPPAGIEALGDLTGFVKVDLRDLAQEAPPPVAENLANETKPVAADPIVKNSAFGKFLGETPAPLPARPETAEPRRKPARATVKADATRRVVAKMDAPPPTGRETHSPARAAAHAAKGSPRAAKRDPDAVKPSGNPFTRLAGRLSLPFFGRKSARDETPARTPQELAAAIRATTEFRKGTKAGAAGEIRAQAAQTKDPRSKAGALFEAGDYAAAVESYDLAIANAPKDATLRKFRGLALASLDRYDEAVDELRRAAELTPDDGTVRLALARSLGGRGRARLDAGDPSGRADLEKALLLDPSLRTARKALERASASGAGGRG